MKPPPPVSAPLDVADYRDATVMPVIPHQHRRPETFEYGVFNKRGKVVRTSLLFRSYGRQGFPAEFVPTSRTDTRTVIFGGHLVNMYGHFLLEGLSRLWFAKANPELPIVWACDAGQQDVRYRSWHRQILDVLGIRNEAVFLTESTRFKRVHVPQPGYRIKDWCADQYADFLAVYPKRPRDPDLKLWLSRAEVNHALGSVFAHRLDREVAQHGWRVVRMETLSVRDQLELLATASRVAGEEGSAFHTLALLSDVSGLEVDIIGRRPQRAPEDQNQNYETLARARGLSQRMHVVPEERVLFERGRIVRKVTTTMAGHLEVADVARPEAIPVPTAPEAVHRLVQRIATDIAANTYLEISADPAAARTDPVAPVRDIVRPAFSGDPREVDGDGTQLYEMPPDEFFDFCATSDRQYDLIQLDAVGAPWLVWWWFVASRRYAHEGTVWVIRGADDHLAAQLASMLRSEVVDTPDGPCLLVLGPAADAAVLTEATR